MVRPALFSIHLTVRADCHSRSRNNTSLSIPSATVRLFLPALACPALTSTAHPTDIFAVAPTKTALLSASGSSSIHVYSTTEPDFPLTQTLHDAHKLGCHHIATSANGQKAASAGFGGDVKLWALAEDGSWKAEGSIAGLLLLIPLLRTR